MEKTLLIRLQGAMQSWGIQGRHKFKDCGTEPSKSGVLLMIAAAFGINDKTPVKQGVDLNALRKLKMAVRVDSPGMADVDFQTARNIYKVSMTSDFTTEERRKILCNEPIDRKKKDLEFRAVVINKMYLHDANFLVALTGDEELISKIVAALNDPEWFVYLGRNSCPPAQPLVAGVRDQDDPVKVLMNEPWQNLLRLKNKPETLRLVSEEDSGQVRRDVPLGRQTYSTRHVRTRMIPTPAEVQDVLE